MTAEANKRGRPLLVAVALEFKDDVRHLTVIGVSGAGSHSRCCC